MKFAMLHPDTNLDSLQKLEEFILSGPRELVYLVMSERQFWQLNSLARTDTHNRPWTSFMGRKIIVLDMNRTVATRLGLITESFT